MKPNELWGKDYQPFCEQDPYNPQNLVEGFISRKSNEYYGALLITKINNRDVPEQLIMGSPKMHYPFDSRADGTRNYRFPVARNIEVYEKLDGTNILAYLYSDGETPFLSYKTRLRPFVFSGRFGDFPSMWKEVGERYESIIRRVMAKHDCNLSFELYGALNTHLIVYKIPLDAALLFGVTNSGKILSPLQDLKDPDLPVVDRLTVIDKDYAQNYEEFRLKLEAGLTKEEEGRYSGIEGTVWYLHTPDGLCIQLKCKPETIEAIHFAAGAGLSKNAAIATCWNAFENVDILTVDFVKQLLLEEFEQRIIDDNTQLIESAVAFVTEEANFRQTVLKEYRSTGMNILTHKVEVMRLLSTKFPRYRMKRVHSIIAGYG